ncbi:MAG TPA: hypothetical protein VF065_05770 [Ilumatobacter sp.]
MTTTDDPSRIDTRTAALALLASSVGDPAGTRTITSIVLLLAVLGIALLMLAIWLFRLTRPDKELLAPLEVMGERKWRRADPVWQRRRLDEVRPTEAQPLQPSAAPPDFDEAFFDHVPAASGFADLHDDAHRDGEPSPEAVAPPAADEVPAQLEVPVESTEPVANGMSIAAKPRPAAAVKPVSPTPIGIERPMELPDRDIDPELLAAAIAELDAELQLGRDRKPQASD